MTDAKREISLAEVLAFESGAASVQAELAALREQVAVAREGLRGMIGHPFTGTELSVSESFANQLMARARDTLAKMDGAK